MGFGFPTGMRLISAVDAKPTPWFWGINGAAGVLASSLAVLCSIAFGITATMTLAAVSYLSLASELSGPGGRARTISIMWFMMIVSIILTALGVCLQYGKYNVLFFRSCHIIKLHGFSNFNKFGYGFEFEFCEVHRRSGCGLYFFYN